MTAVQYNKLLQYAAVQSFSANEQFGLPALEL